MIITGKEMRAIEKIIPVLVEYSLAMVSKNPLRLTMSANKNRKLINEIMKSIIDVKMCLNNENFKKVENLTKSFRQTKVAFILIY